MLTLFSGNKNNHLKNRFSINFVENSSGQCIFHLDFRFNEEEPYKRTIVRNTNFPSGDWGAEERADNPLQRGEPFKIQIKVLEDRFSVRGTN